MPVFHGHISRNVMMTDIFKVLSSREEIRLVIFTYNFKKDYFQQQYGRANVIIEGVDMKNLPGSRIERIFKSLFPFFVDSPRVRMMFREALDENHNYFSYYSKRLITAVIGNFPWVRKCLKRVYFKLVSPKHYFMSKFEEYRPDLVFLPDMTFDADTYILRAAKASKVPSVAMLRSFDTVTSNKGTIRIQPDLLLVHNKFMKEDAVRWCDVDPGKVVISGMPHFDHYLTDTPMPKEEFFSRLGLDPSKRVILFGLTGPRTSGINQDMIDIMAKAIDDGRLPQDVQLLVRMHPNADKESFKKNPHVILHRPEGIYFGQGRLTDMEFTKEWLHELFDTLYYSDVTVNPQSTLTLDSAAFDRPVINLAFDGYEKLPYVRSVARLYVDYSHYVPILKAGAARLAHNEEELIQWLNKYLSDPLLDREGRKRALEEQCYIFDGRNGERTAQHVLDFMNSSIQS